MPIRRRQFTALTAAALAVPWLARAQSANLSGLYEAAKKEGELTWYAVPYTSEVSERMGRTFTARYPGVKVTAVRTTAQVAFQRLNQDLKAGTPNCDVFTSTDLAHFVDLKARKLLLKYEPEAAARLDKRVRNIDPDGYFHTTSAFMMGLVYNTNKVEGAAVPTSWTDLVDPKWNGTALLAHPAYSGAAGAWCIEMRKLYGDGWFSKLAANKVHVGRSTIDAVTSVVSGESLISAGPMSLAARSAAKGNPVATRAPKEGPVLIVAPSAIMSDSRHPNAAKLFEEWMLGSEDVERIAFEEYGVPLRPGVKTAPGVLGLGDANPLLVPSPTDMVSGIPKVIELWKDAFGV